jgi:hypothetical protein
MDINDPVGRWEILPDRRAALSLKILSDLRAAKLTDSIHRNCAAVMECIERHKTATRPAELGMGCISARQQSPLK